MAEKLTNGSFTSNLSGWSNIGTRSFIWNSGRARGTTVGANECFFSLRQSFTKYGTVLSALVSANLWYYASTGDDSDGQNYFRIELDIPGGGTVILYEATYGAGSGSDSALDDTDISSHLTNNGTYYLRLSLYGRASSSGGLVDTASYGEYDDISIQVTEKFTHSIIETIGAGEAPVKKLSVLKTAILGFIESLSSIGGRDISGNETMAQVEKVGLVEIIGRVVKITVIEVLGALEALARSYGYCHRDIPSDSIGLLESMSARVRAGNISKIVTRFDVGTEWTERAPVDTEWEQTR